MKFEVTGNNLSEISADGIIVFYFSGKSTRAFEKLDNFFHGIISEQIKTDNFKAKIGDILTFYTQRKALSPKIFVVGLGKKEEFSNDKLRKAMASFAKSVKNKLNSITLSPLDSSEVDLDIFTQAKLMAEGLLLGDYTFNKYRKVTEEEKELEIVIFSESNKNTQLKIKEGVKEARIYYEATKIARDLVNEQSAVVNPTFLAKLAQDIAKANPEVTCTVFDKSELEKMGMEAFLGIARGSDTPPKFIFLEYKPKRGASRRKLAIIGKGITFDTGGVSLKREGHMTTMKIDMAGAAAVLGVFSVISEIKPDYSVMGIIAATPNLVSGKSIVPGDVVRALNGKTIEVLNTDAEGRVTMADSLSYAVKKGATEIIDLATLTGACEVALGTSITGLFTNNNVLADKVKKAAADAGEKVWELPMEKEYKELNKSEVADIANIPNTRYGGAIAAAWFLEEFVDNKPWVHLDIAGPAFAEKKFDLGPKGGTGFGVRTLLNLLRNF